MGVNISSNGISPKVTVLTWLKFELKTISQSNTLVAICQHKKLINNLFLKVVKYLLECCKMFKDKKKSCKIFKKKKKKDVKYFF